jgi:uncharacterized lipoprotein YajG
MKTAHAGMKRRTIAALVAGAALLAGCSVTVTPKNVPLIKETEAVSLSGVSVIVTNAEKDAAEHAILTDRAAGSGLRANRRAWSGKLVETLARELARRGARVSSTAPLTLGVSLPEITFVKTGELYQLRVKVVISSTTGWSKNYEGIAGLSASSVWSISDETDQLAGRALAGAVKDALGDAEFLAQLGKR